MLSLQISLTVAKAMTHRWRPLGDIIRGNALTSNQEALTFHMIHASFLQSNSVPSGNSDRNAPSKRENSALSGPKQLAGNSQKTVLSEPCKGSIKQTNTSQVLVSETVPDRRVQPSRQAKMTRFEDNPVTSTVAIPPRRQPRHDTSTRNRREFQTGCDWPRSAHSNQADKG